MVHRGSDQNHHSVTLHSTYPIYSLPVPALGYITQISFLSFQGRQYIDGGEPGSMPSGTRGDGRDRGFLADY